MNTALSPRQLKAENRCHRGHGGVSEENRGVGFRPAVLDTRTLRIYPSRFLDGRPAPCHLLDGLPDEVVELRDAGGRVLRAISSIVSGFVRDGQFFNRDEAAAAVAQLH